MGGVITVKTFGEAHRVAMLHGNAKVQRIHKGAWMVTFYTRASRLSRKLKRKKASL